MVREVLELRTDNGMGDNNPTFHDIEITDYSFKSPRMGMPTLTATLMWPTCIDDEWTDKEYVVLRGEKYYVHGTPSSEKNNTDSRYKHSLEFRSEREQLGKVYFYDVVPSWSSTYDKPNTNSTEFKFFGTIVEYADRMNCAFRYAGIGDSILNRKTTLTDADSPVGDGYCVVVSGYGDGDLNVSKEMSFSDQWLWDALTEGYNKYEIPFAFRGKKIVFNEAYSVVNHVFKYGHNNSLLSVKKNNANAKIINRITFKGSSENIPHYYPNENERGKSVITVPISNKKLKASDILILNEKQLLANINEGENVVFASTLERRFQFPGDPVWRNVPDSGVADIIINFTTTEQEHYVLTELIGEIWRVNEAPTNDMTSNWLASDPKVTIRRLTLNGGIITPLGDGTYNLGTLDPRDNTIIVTVKFNITKHNALPKFRVPAIRMTNGQKTAKFWRKGSQTYDSIGAFGLGLADNNILNTLESGESFSLSYTGRMPFQTNLMPPKYRSTKGAERFYNALNNTYKDPDTNKYYEFPNPYVAGNPNEYIYVNEEIKPTIEGVRNAVITAENPHGELFGEIAGLGYDIDDNDSLKAESEDDKEKNDAENYAHSFFYLRLHKFNGPYGFDLFKHASQTDPMTLQMTSGKCNGCKFKIQVLEVEKDGVVVWQNPVQTIGPNGGLLGGTQDNQIKKDNIQEWQQDTSQYSIWIAVQKDASTFGVIMPNRTNNYMPSVGDTFNIINIDLPQGYVEAAEKRGEEEMLRFMSDNNEEKFTFDISASRIFFAENKALLSELDENSRIKVEYNGRVWEQYVSEFGIECKNNEALPDIKIALTDSLAVGQSFVEQVSERAATLIANATTLGYGATGGGMSAGLAERRYLNKQKSDRTPYKLSSDTGVEVGDFVSGASGGIFFLDKETGYTYAEVDMLKVRMKAIFERLEIANVSSIGGKLIVTPGGSITISFVEEITQTSDDVTTIIGYRCYFKAKDDEKGSECRFAVNDQVLSQEFNVSAGTYENASNNYYWRLVTAVDNENSYVELSNVEEGVGFAAGSNVPQVGDVLCHLGNPEDKTRQSAIVISTVDAFAPCITLYNGIDSYSLDDRAVIEYGVDKTKTPPRPFFHCYGEMFIGPKDQKTYVKFTPERGVEIRGRLTVDSTVGDTLITDFIKENSGVSEDISNFIDNALKGIQDQIDGVIETFFADGAPSMTVPPASEWVAIDNENGNDNEKIRHLGDLYYDNLTGSAYRFSQKSDGTYFWTVITDEAITKALAAAQKAQDTADGKRRIFTQQPTPPYDEGDLWVNATYGSQYSNDILRCVTKKANGAAFSISDWTLASKYTDDTVAIEARDRLSKWAQDGLFSPPEFPELKLELVRIESTKNEYDQQYQLYGDLVNKLDGASQTKATFDTAYNSYHTMLNDILTADRDEDGCVPVPADFAVKMNAYYAARANMSAVLANLAKLASVNAVADLDYLKEALQQKSITEGGLFLTSLIALGVGDPQHPDDISKRITWSGINGIIVPDKGTRSIATWYGGSQTDKEDYYEWDESVVPPRWTLKSGVTQAQADAARIATGLVRMDGSGYFANGNLWWDTTGNLHADPLSFFVGENSVGNVLGLFKFNPSNTAAFANVKSVTPQRPFTSLWLSSPDGAHMIELTYDATHNALRVKGNMYADGWLSFRGANDGSGGSAVAGAANLSDLKDVSLGTLAAGQALVWNGAKWVNSTIATSGLDEASLSNYLTSHGYATQQWANDRYYTKTEVDAKNFIKDIGDGRSLMFNYSANALGYDNFTWVAVWNGNTLQCCNKSLFATASALASGLSGKVNKAGDTMTGHLTIHNGTYNKTLVLSSAGADAKSKGPGILFNGSETDRSQGIVLRHEWYDTFTPGYGLAISRDTSLETGDANMWLYNTGRYISKVPTGTKPIDVVSTTLCTNLNADMLDGLHNGEVTARLVNYNNGGNVSSAVQFMQKANGWNEWDAPTQEWYSVIKLNHGNGDTYYNRTLAFNFFNHTIRTGYMTGGDFKGWKTLAFTDSTVANADKLGGKAAAQYVTTDTVQEITGRKTIRGASLKLLGLTTSNTANRHSAGVLTFQENAYDDQFGIWGYFSGTGASQKLFIGGSGAGTSLANDQNGTTLTPYLTIEHTTGNLTVLGKIIKSGGTAAQFLMADGSVVTKKTATAPCDLGWVNNNTGNSSVPTIAVLAYWNGCYKGTGSNLQYCDRGRFGTMATASASDYLARSGGSMTNTNVVTNLNADMLDGLHEGAFMRQGMGRLSTTTDFDIRRTCTNEVYNYNPYSFDENFGTIVTFTSGVVNFAGQFYLPRFSGSHISYRGKNDTNNTWAAWSKLAFLTDNVASATKLQTARTIWGQSFNGTGNVSGDMTGVGTITSTYYSLHNISNSPYLKFNVDGKITYVQALSTGIGVGPIHTALFVTNDSKVGIGTASPSEKLSVAGWVGTIGDTGWYNITHGGGWYMSDSAWVRTYNNKGIYSGTGEIRNNSYFNRTVYEGSSWNNGYGAYNVGIISNSSQTPLMVAYRNGYAVDVTGANRLFALELLNSGAEMHFAFGGSTKFSMTSAGVFFANGGIWTNGYMSFKGQNTLSDARQKRILRDIHVPLKAIAKAPNVVFSWLDTGKLDMGSIAQYWQKHLPLSVYVRPNGYLGMDYSKVALACVISTASELLGVKDSVSELKCEVRQLKHENQQLKQQIDRMERRIA